MTAKRLPWAALGLLLTGAAINVAFVACGSESEEIAEVPEAGDPNETGTGTDTSTGADTSTNPPVDGSADADGSLLDGQICLVVGAACGGPSDCCTKTCNKIGAAAVGECAPPPNGGGCLAATAACVNSTECCTNSCVGNQCSATQCKADTPIAATCTTNAECCSAKCDIGGTGKCTAIGGGSCRTEGNPCAVNNECCSNQCDSTKHCSNASFCSQVGDVCATDFECCGGSCDKAAGATLGRCSNVGGGGGCAPAGTVCTGLGCSNACCSLSCGPLGATGVNICQPPSGCRPQNELCLASGDCCGGPGRPHGRNSNGSTPADIQCIVGGTDTFGRCESAQCLQPGTVCKAPVGACGGTSNNCCEPRDQDGGAVGNSFCNSTPEACCSRDALGIPRCRAVGFVCGDGGTVAAGQLCATSADCCGKPCLLNKCEGACVPKGGGCTVNADCCSPQPCVVPTGSTKGICGGVLLSDGGVTPPPDGGSTDAGTPSDAGTCSLYGQSCAVSANCCSGVPCTNLTCRYP